MLKVALGSDGLCRFADILPAVRLCCFKQQIVQRMLAIVRVVRLPNCFLHSALAAAGCSRVKGRSSSRHNSSIVRCGMLLPELENQHQTFSRKLPLEETLMVVQIPPPDQFIGPRIEHIQVTSDGLLSEAVAAALDLPQWFVLELIRFGAVHHRCAATAPQIHPPAP